MPTYRYKSITTSRPVDAIVDSDALFSSCSTNSITLSLSAVEQVKPVELAGFGTLDSVRDDANLIPLISMNE